MQDRQQDFVIDFVLVTDAKTAPRVRTVDGITVEIMRHFTALGASVHLIRVTPGSFKGRQ
jgi:hypothetical protein